MPRATYPFDVEPLGLGLGKAEASSVHEQPRDAQQLHGRPNQAGGDDVVDKEGAIVREENAPSPGTERGETERMLRQELQELLAVDNRCSRLPGKSGSFLLLTGT